MTTTDTDALQERIARAAAASEGFGPDHPDHEFVVGEYLSDAQFLAPFIAAEVQAAKAEALREIAPHLNDSGDESFLLAAATEYETGDRA